MGTSPADAACLSLVPFPLMTRHGISCRSPASLVLTPPAAGYGAAEPSARTAGRSSNSGRREDRYAGHAPAPSPLVTTPPIGRIDHGPRQGFTGRRAGAGHHRAAGRNARASLPSSRAVPHRADLQTPPGAGVPTPQATGQPVSFRTPDGPSSPAAPRPDGRRGHSKQLGPLRRFQTPPASSARRTATVKLMTVRSGATTRPTDKLTSG